MVFDRQGLEPGISIAGPAIITEYAATTYVAQNWAASRDEFGNILLVKSAV
jgi:N-methylhydantoinase A